MSLPNIELQSVSLMGTQMDYDAEKVVKGATTLADNRKRDQPIDELLAKVQESLQSCTELVDILIELLQ